jgi:hypothetical protein
VTVSAPTTARGPARATIVLGPAAFLAGIGYIAGWVAGAVRGQTFPDYAEFAATLGLAGAGVGWVLGALVGISISDGNRKISRRGAPVLWVAAAAAIGAGIAIAAQEESMLWTKVLSEDELPWLRLATVADGVIVALTLLIASFLGRTDEDAVPVAYVGGVFSVLSIVLLAVTFVTSVSFVFVDHRNRVERRIGIPASTTMYELLREAERFHDRRGRFPDDLAHVLALGGDIHPGSQVAFAGPVGDGFCVIVGISEGRDEPGEPV